MAFGPGKNRPLPIFFVKFGPNSASDLPANYQGSSVSSGSSCHYESGAQAVCDGRESEFKGKECWVAWSSQLYDIVSENSATISAPHGLNLAHRLISGRSL